MTKKEIIETIEKFPESAQIVAIIMYDKESDSYKGFTNPDFSFSQRLGFIELLKNGLIREINQQHDQDLMTHMLEESKKKILEKIEEIQNQERKVQ